MGTIDLLDIRSFPPSQLVWSHPQASALIQDLLRDESKQGRAASEDWYKKPRRWYASRARRRPYNDEYNEVPVLAAHEEEIRRFAKDSSLVFLGVGVGDSELAIAKWPIQDGCRAEIYAVDIGHLFLTDFASAIKKAAARARNKFVFFRGLLLPFQHLDPKRLSGSNVTFRTRTYVNLGNTVGNAPHQEQFFSMLERLLSPGDRLILGYHRLNNLALATAAYKSNVPLTEIVRASASAVADVKRVRENDIAWDHDQLPWDPQYQAVLARHKQSGRVVFFSIKYDADQIGALARRHGLRSITEHLTRNGGGAAITVLEKS